MNIEHYQKFREYDEKGLKKNATFAIRDFISSFNDREEIKKWVWEYLPDLKINRHSRIRHEIFYELVFPILKEGYENNDFKSTLWLGKLSQNMYQCHKIHEKLDWITETNLYSKCHEIDPENDEARLLLLKSIISWLEYAEHEWPSGILYGINGATIEQCDEIRSEVLRVLSLDKESQYPEFTKQFNQKLSQYQARLKK